MMPTIKKTAFLYVLCILRNENASLGHLQHKSITENMANIEYFNLNRSNMMVSVDNNSNQINQVGKGGFTEPFLSPLWGTYFPETQDNISEVPTATETPLTRRTIKNNSPYSMMISNGPQQPRRKRAYDYVALDSYANEVTEEYCPPAPPSRPKFSVFGFLGMMVSLSMTVANVINAINNNNNNNDNNNNDNNNNNNDLNAAGGGGGGAAGDAPVRNVVPVRINDVGQHNANADLGSDGLPTLTNARPATSRPNTISFGGRTLVSNEMQPREFISHRAIGNFESQSSDLYQNGAFKTSDHSGYILSSGNQNLKETKAKSPQNICSCKTKRSTTHLPKTNKSYGPGFQKLSLNLDSENKTNYTTIHKEDWLGLCIRRFFCEQELEMQYSGGMNLMFLRIMRMASYSFVRRTWKSRVLLNEYGLQNPLIPACGSFHCPMFSILGIMLS
ncbi:probable serine/threonine-protein kinase DDB_G0267686 [Macrobrachium rosenbergii]|uniref:probable serine/threonine-protein kinase DDB_G0267686 n=1 Tax=Macrobrachium rosenbergii TaxID=79674 RepID=UPI0034D4A671